MRRILLLLLLLVMIMVVVGVEVVVVVPALRLAVTLIVCHDAGQEGGEGGYLLIIISLSPNNNFYSPSKQAG